MFIQYLPQDPSFYFTTLLLVGFSICLHELAHAWTALKCGDATAADAGHLSMNPLVQMGPVSMVILAVIGIAWGAVPINPRALTRGQRALVAAAGPATNLILCLLFGLATGLALRWGGPEFTAEVLFRASMLNGVLFLFNMLPVPPLDGWTVLGLFVRATDRLDPAMARQIATMGLLVLFLSPATGYLWAAGEFLARQAAALTGI